MKNWELNKHGTKQDDNKELNALYYTIPIWEPVYIRKAKDSNINFEDKFEDERDKGFQRFENLVENVEEAFTIDKTSKYDNSFLEFLGDGVISLFLAWDLVTHYVRWRDQADLDTRRIQGSSSKKLFEVNIQQGLYEFVSNSVA